MIRFMDAEFLHFSIYHCFAFGDYGFFACYILSVAISDWVPELYILTSIILLHFGFWEFLSTKTYCNYWVGNLGLLLLAFGVKFDLWIALKLIDRKICVFSLFAI